MPIVYIEINKAAAAVHELGRPKRNAANVVHPALRCSAQLGNPLTQALAARMSDGSLPAAPVLSDVKLVQNCVPL